MTRRLVTMPEAEQEFGWPVDTQRWWRHHGLGPKSFRIGRRVVYDRVDIEAWIQEQKAKSA